MLTRPELFDPAQPAGPRDAGLRLVQEEIDLADLLAPGPEREGPPREVDHHELAGDRVTPARRSGRLLHRDRIRGLSLKRGGTGRQARCGHREDEPSRISHFLAVAPRGNASSLGPGVASLQPVRRSARCPRIRATLQTMIATWRVPFTGALLVALSAAGSVAAARPRGRKARLPALPSVILPPDASEKDRAVGEACRRALEGRRGSVVAMDPRTGRVIALVNPAYGLFKAYTPCSVFKIVVAIAGLSEGVVRPERTYTCAGGCWIWPGHGPIDLRRALAVSCNPYFEWIGEQLGYDKIQRYAHLLGLGSPSGINLTGETTGKLPRSVRPTAVGHLSSHASGIAASPLQVAVLLSAAINGGIVFQPQVSGAAGFVTRERWRLPPGTVLSGLADGFVAAVNEGSASSAFDPDISVAGKTGSCAHLGWFASYAPADQPEVVVVVFIRGGNGHQASAIAGRIYQDVYRPQPAVPAPGGGF